MGYKEKRTLIKVGKTSRALILPKPWVDFYGEDAEEVIVIGDAILIVAPKSLEGKARELLKKSEQQE